MWNVNEYLAYKSPCKSGYEYALKFKDMAAVWEDCSRVDWLLWLLRHIATAPKLFPNSPIDWLKIAQELIELLDKLDSVDPARRQAFDGMLRSNALWQSVGSQDMIHHLTAGRRKVDLRIVNKLKELIPNPFKANPPPVVEAHLNHGV